MTERVLHLSRTRAADYLAEEVLSVKARPKVTTRLRPERKAALKALCYAKGISMDEGVELCIEWAWTMLVAMPAREVLPLARPNRRRRGRIAPAVRDGQEGQEGVAGDKTEPGSAGRGERA